MSRMIRLFLIIVLCAAAFERGTHANKNFVPDWTFTGSSLSDTEQLGDASWAAQNGEVIAKPSSANGGWLGFNKPLQDAQMAASHVPTCSRVAQAALGT